MSKSKQDIEALREMFPQVSSLTIQTIVGWNSSLLPYCTTCAVEFNGPAASANHYDGGERSNHSRRLRYIEARKNNQVNIGCDLCCCQVNSESQLEHHLKSLKHIRHQRAKHYTMQLERLYERIFLRKGEAQTPEANIGRDESENVVLALPMNNCANREESASGAYLRSQSENNDAVLPPVGSHANEDGDEASAHQEQQAREEKENMAKDEGQKRIVEGVGVHTKVDFASSRSETNPFDESHDASNKRVALCERQEDDAPGAHGRLPDANFVNGQQANENILFDARASSVSDERQSTRDPCPSSPDKIRFDKKFIDNLLYGTLPWCNPDED